MVLSSLLTGALPARSIRITLMVLLLPGVLPEHARAVPNDADWRVTESTRLRMELDRIREQSGVAGLGLVIADSDRNLLVLTLGLADWDSGTPIRPDHYVRIGSITKAFTGLAFLELDRQGLIGLDDPLRDHLNPPPLVNPWPQAHPVRVVHLLEHTAGLLDMSRKEFDHNRPLSLAEALRIDPDSRRLRWPSGLHASYSNSGAGIAAHVMEQATGLDFEAFLVSAILRPMGMPSATFDLDAEVRNGLVAGYDRDGRTRIPYWHTLYRPFGGLNVRIVEMGRLLQLCLGKGRLDGQVLLPPEAIKRAETPTSTMAARAGLEFGYGLGNHAFVHDGQLMHGHGGDADGYLSFFGYSHAAGLGYFLVINAFQPDTLRTLRALVQDFILRGVEARHQPAAPQRRSQLRALAGTYRRASWRFGSGPADMPARTVQVEFESDRLYLVRSGERQHLVPVAAGLFRRPSEPLATVAFIEHGGEWFLQGPFGNFKRVQDPAGSSPPP